MALIKLDFTNYAEAQDMIKLIMQEKGFSVVEAINFTITPTIYRRILKTGWGSIALSVWGHGDPERMWQSLEEPKVEMELESNKIRALEEIIQKEDVNTETALSYFLIFTMESLGYHI